MDYPRGRLPGSNRPTDLLGRVQLVWEVTGRHSLRRRARTALHSLCIDVAGIAGAEFDFLSSPQILLKADSHSCPSLIRDTRSRTNEEKIFHSSLVNWHSRIQVGSGTQVFFSQMKLLTLINTWLQPGDRSPGRSETV